MTVYDRARAYVSKMDPAIAGSNGHDATFRVACILVEGFSLSFGDALEIMREYNSRCDPPWSEHELEHKVRSAEGKVANPGYLLRGTSAEQDSKRGPVKPHAKAETPRPRKQKRPDFSVKSLRDYVLGMLQTPVEFFMDRSAVPIPAEGEQGWETSRLFFETIYQKGERLLIFKNEMSQGQWIYEVGRGLFRLAKEPGEKAIRETEPPDSGPCGIWYLAQPVDGIWRKGPKTMTRRSGSCVQSWDWFVLESDEADESDWLKFLSKVPLPIAAIYTSGGRSYHALVKIGAKSKAEWDVLRDEIFYKLLCPLGGDGGAMSAVRLTRLPGMMRRGKRDKEGKMNWYDKPRRQRLIYLEPNPEWKSIRLKEVKA